MIKFFHKILIFLFEKITPSSTFNANQLSDSVHTLKKMLKMLGFYCVKPISQVIFCAAKLLLNSNILTLLFDPLPRKGIRHQPFFGSKIYAFKITSFPMLLKSLIRNIKNIRASHTSFFLNFFLKFYYVKPKKASQKVCEAKLRIDTCSAQSSEAVFLIRLREKCAKLGFAQDTTYPFLAQLGCASCSRFSTFFSFNKVGDCLRFLFLLPSLLKSNILKARNLKISGPWFFTSFYFVFMLILPIFSLLNAASKNLFDHFWETATEPVALSAYTVTISMAFFACIFNAFFGFILAWVLVRYNFPGKRLLDAAVDLPFALPTSVAGLTLATVYSDQGWVGSFLSTVGIQIVFTKLGILIAMIFVSFPFVVRTLQPVLQEMEIELEEAAWSLGASPWKTFRKVIFPPLIPAILTGLTLAFSRAIGEYGSIVIVSSNIPLKDLIASVLIFQNLEQYDYTRATVIGTVVLLLSLFLLLGINFLQSWNQKYLKF